jgi:hypothetical protein
MYERDREMFRDRFKARLRHEMAGGPRGEIAGICPSFCD